MTGQAGVSAASAALLRQEICYQLLRGYQENTTTVEAVAAFIETRLAALATAPPEQAAEPKCWHKEINDEGICKACGAKAAIKLEGLSVRSVSGRSAMGVHTDGLRTSQAAKENQAMNPPQAVSAGALSAELTDFTHMRSCPMLNPMSEELCTCGLEWRIKLRTEMEMHNAWRKRAEEAEAALAAHDQKVRAEVLEEAAKLAVRYSDGPVRAGEPSLPQAIRSLIVDAKSLR